MVTVAGTLSTTTSTDGVGKKATIFGPYTSCFSSYDNLVYFIDNTVYLRTFNPITNEVKTLTKSGDGFRSVDGSIDPSKPVSSHATFLNSGFNGAAFDSIRNIIYFTESYTGKIRRIDLTTKMTSTLVTSPIYVDNVSILSEQLKV